MNRKIFKHFNATFNENEHKKCYFDYLTGASNFQTPVTNFESDFEIIKNYFSYYFQSIKITFKIIELNI